jgi:putative ABC transport system substrate-binding protein
MMRRKFLVMLGGATVWPIAVRGQPATLPVIGFLRSASFDNAAPLVAAFRAGRAEMDFIEGQNVTIEFRSAEGHNDRLPGLVAELLRGKVAVLVCNVSAASAAKAATKTVPIVFATGSDPVQDALVTSLSRPEGNVTGVSAVGNALGAKQVELLRELLPAAKTLAVLADATFSGGIAALKDIEAEARRQEREIVLLKVGSERDLDVASAALDQRRADALLVLGAALFLSQRDRIVALAARHSIPAIYQDPEYVSAGGLMSYGASIPAPTR